MSHLPKTLTHISKTWAWLARHVFALALTFAFALVLPLSGMQFPAMRGRGRGCCRNSSTFMGIGPHRIGDCDRGADPTSCYTTAKQVNLALLRTGRCRSAPSGT